MFLCCQDMQCSGMGTGATVAAVGRSARAGRMGGWLKAVRDRGTEDEFGQDVDSTTTVTEPRGCPEIRGGCTCMCCQGDDRSLL